MKKIRMGLLVLFILIWNFQYFQVFLPLDLTEQDLVEEVQLKKRILPRLASNGVSQSFVKQENQTIEEKLNKNIDKGLEGFIGGFLENRGQKSEIIYYYTESALAGVGFGASTLYYSVINPITDGNHNLLDEEEVESKWTYTTVGLTFLDCNNVIPTAKQPTEVFTNYFFGSDPKKWAISQYYTKIIYYNIYENIDLVYELKDGQLKYEFFVHPGGNFNDIKLQWIGPISLNQVEGGIKLSIQESDLSFIDSTPICYQSKSREKPILATFEIYDSTTYGFSVSDYDRNRLLIIDPVLNLTYSTYVSGSLDDDMLNLGDMVIDDVGSAYVTGSTYSIDFPTINAFNSTGDENTSTYDVFVFKLAADGSTLLYSTYIGGNNEEWSYGIAVDSSGNVYVTGYTNSTDFPTVNAYNATGDGNSSTYDIFVLKLSANGTNLLYSTYVGGSKNDYGNRITVDDKGDTYVTGSTFSVDFPTINAFNSTGDGNTSTDDVVVFKLAANGSSLLYSTYINGNGSEVARGIAIDAVGNSYVAGYTNSIDFPTANAYNATGEGTGGYDMFALKLAANGSSLYYSTYVSGSSMDAAQGLALDNAGNAYITGLTTSNDFPTVNPYNATGDGSNYDVVVCKLAANGSTLLYSTYVSGNEMEWSRDIVVDGAGNAYVTGFTNSYNFPTINAYNSSGDCNISYQDAYVFKLNRTGNGLLFSTYLSGSHDDYGRAIDLGSAGEVYVAGATWSDDFPTVNPYNATGDGDTSHTDVFMSKFTFNDDPIYIDENSDFQSLGFPGKGTPTDPYFIEGFHITNSTTHLIRIQNTDVHFIVRNNVLNGLHGNYDGIRLDDVVNGTFQGNIISDCLYGMWVSTTNDSVISGNTIHSNENGGIVIVNWSYNNTFISNKVYNHTEHGVSLFNYAINNTITGNTIYNNSLSSNTGGIDVTSSDYNNITNNIIFDNSRSGIRLSSCSNNRLFNNTIYNNSKLSGGCGIYLYSGSHNNYIIGNNVSRNLMWGIIVQSNNNYFFNNSIHDNSLDGVYISVGTNNTFYRNDVYNNNRGFDINADDNWIYFNNIQDNSITQAWDETGNNHFHRYGLGNYWGSGYTGSDINGDTVGDTPYILSGNQDPYPLMFNIQWYKSFNISAIDGDWYVTGTEYHQNKFITLTGNLIIQSGANFTLHNVILRFNCSSEGQYVLDVNGGNLTIIGNSLVTTLNTSNAWLLQANIGSVVTLKNSTFCYAGYFANEFSGLWIQTNEVYIHNCTIHHNFVGLNLDNSNDSLISYNTLYNNSDHGIRLWYSNNNTLSHNILYNNIKDGISLEHSNNNTVLNNTLINNRQGIYLYDAIKNNISYNIIQNSTTTVGAGIYLWVNSNNNSILYNEISNNNDDGITLQNTCNYNNISHNIIYNNNDIAIWLFTSSNYNILFNNTLHHNSNSWGIHVSSSSNNTIRSNNIYDNLGGIVIYSSSQNNTVTYNKITNNTNWGIYLYQSPSNNTIKWNNLIGNSPQGWDDGSYNIFQYNYWDDHTGTDVDADGIYDNPYSILGGTNTDPYPRTNPFFPHAVIYITHETNFTALGLPGQGTISNPYIIEGYFISDIGSLIQIVDISAYFIIRSNLLIGKAGGDGIRLDNCTNGYIVDNKIRDTTTGIYLFESSNNTIFNNSVTNTIFGMIITNDSTANSIYNNSIYNNSVYGVIISFTTNNNITSNLIFNNTNLGISLFCANYITVSNNTIYNHFDATILGHGIAILPYKHLNAEHNIITNNSIYNNANDGIYANSSAYTTISLNRIFNNSRNGIYIESASNENITGNLIWNNGEAGVFLNNSHINNTLVNNTVSYNFWGISLENSSNNTFTGCSIFNNTIDGIKLVAFSANNTFVMNRIHDNSGSGIYIESSGQNLFRNNTIYNHTTYYGVFLETNSNGNSFKWNDFLTNNIGGSQAYDDGSNNIFDLNYWDDHTGLDSDQDGIFDNSYSIFGDALNFDPHPLVSLNNPVLIHTLSMPIVLYPNGGEVLSGVINIQWTEAIDSYGLEVLYTVYYSTNNGLTWVELNSSIINTYYPWNTASRQNSTSYLVRIVANSDGLTESDDSDATFTIQNPPINESIVVIGNAGFETLNVPGDGTEGDPYIIEGLYFVDDSMIVIHIMNTNVHFIIRNNVINGSSGEFFGVHFLNVTNGIIENNHIYNCSEGITFFDSQDCVVFNNSIYHNSENGIHLRSNSIEISANTIHFNGANGIFLENSNNNNISDNIIHFNGANGIFLENSDDNIISSNTIYGNGDTGTGTGIGANLQASNRGNGIFLDPADDNIITNNTIHSNFEDGICLLDSNSAFISENTINDNGANGITLEDSDENTISDNIIYGNGDVAGGTGIGASLQASNRGNGIFLDPADDNTISNNKIYENEVNGIYILESETTQIFSNIFYGNGFNAIFLELSNLNTIFNNILWWVGYPPIGIGSVISTTMEETASNRGNGLFLKVSNENNISSNEIRNYTNYGIVVDEDSSDNMIEWNDFYGNNPEGTSQAYDDGLNNHFVYNYWDDHINTDTNDDGVADSHYKIDGDANNIDQFPMATPDGELIQIPPASDPLLFLVLILLILSVAGIGLAYINRERIKRVIRKRTRKRPIREYDSLVDQAEELARSWEKELKD